MCESSSNAKSIEISSIFSTFSIISLRNSALTFAAGVVPGSVLKIR